jgi:hypothetical protein
VVGGQHRSLSTSLPPDHKRRQWGEIKPDIIFKDSDYAPILLLISTNYFFPKSGSCISAMDLVTLPRIFCCAAMPRNLLVLRGNEYLTEILGGRDQGSGEHPPALMSDHLAGAYRWPGYLDINEPRCSASAICFVSNLDSITTCLITSILSRQT